ncbi:MAG TPA: hypothetical protein VK752_17175 [Bryobacteraceae bacterium]|jgi:hypothetical protein|nr:hypothetical protein [Bryobacteraceae bacterium]
MIRKFNKIALPMAFFGGVLMVSGAPADKDKIADTGVKSAQGTLWVDPGDIQSRNLFYGPGGKQHQPNGTTFTFVDEDLDGTNPKYNVKDQDGVKWKIKLGAEAKPETAATRLVWAVGYFVNEDYFLPDLHVTGLPAHLHRGGKLVGQDGEMKDARLKRHQKGEEKVGNWPWRDDPFAQSREWNGLRVMMALINNWDLKDENNAVYEDGPQRIYMISDLGASFGTTGFNPRQTTSKGNLRGYEHSHFMLKKTREYVDFAVPSRPAILVVFNPAEFFPRMKLRWIGKRVPRSDARWMGQMLAKLSDAQIRDAFRAAGYEPREIDGFTNVVEKRIGELTAL